MSDDGREARRPTERLLRNSRHLEVRNAAEARLRLLTQALGREP